MEISAEVHFAQKLASNEKKYRDRALKRLEKYINIRSSQGDGMSNDDFIKIWKGLHYCMWMQDKPLIQEELSQRIANLLNSFPKLDDSLRFVNVFFITQAREWQLIDKFRIDKFMMLIRDVLRQTFLLMSQAGWPSSSCEMLSLSLAQNVMDETNEKLPDGLKLHLADIYLPELQKMSFKKMNGEKLAALVFPFLWFVLKTRKMNLASKVMALTIRPVLTQYGKWSKIKMAATKDQLPKDDVDEEEEEEEESSDVYEDEDMDVGDGSDQSKNSEELVEMRVHPKFEMKRLLRMMLILTEHKQVARKNRTMVYNIVHQFSRNGLSILQSSEGNMNENNGNMNNYIPDEEDSFMANIKNLMVNGDDDKPGKKKRRRKKKFQEIEVNKNAINQETAGSQTEAIGNSPNQEMSSEAKKQSGKSKKRGREDTSGDIDSSEVKAKKKRRLMPKPEEGDLNNSSKTAISQKSLHDVMDERLAPLAKPNKITQASTTSLDVADSPRTDSNSNSGLPMGFIGDNRALYTSIEIVKHLEKQHKRRSLDISPSMGLSAKTAISKTRCPSKDDLLHSPKGLLSLSSRSKGSTPSSSSQSLSVSSGAEVKVFMPESAEESRKREKKKLKGRKLSLSPKNGDASQMKVSLIRDATGVEDNGGTADGLSGESCGNELASVDRSSLLSDMISTPKALVKKAMAMILPATDPGPERELQLEGKNKKDDPATTPGNKKKVIFDLRKNKANKFKDYLKTVLKGEMPPVFEPSKSPSQSILKPSPASSSTSLDQGLDRPTPSRRKSPNKARTSGSGTKKGRKSSSHGSPKSSSKQSSPKPRKKR